MESATFDCDSVTIRNLDALHDIITLAGSGIIMMGTNIDAVVVVFNNIKYIDWANMEEVISDGSFVASLI